MHYIANQLKVVDNTTFIIHEDIINIVIKIDPKEYERTNLAYIRAELKLNTWLSQRVVSHLKH